MDVILPPYPSRHAPNASRPKHSEDRGGVCTFLPTIPEDQVCDNWNDLYGQEIPLAIAWVAILRNDVLLLDIGEEHVAHSVMETASGLLELDPVLGWDYFSNNNKNSVDDCALWKGIRFHVYDDTITSADGVNTDDNSDDVTIWTFLCVYHSSLMNETAAQEFVWQHMVVFTESFRAKDVTWRMGGTHACQYIFAPVLQQRMEQQQQQAASVQKNNPKHSSSSSLPPGQDTEDEPLLSFRLLSEQMIERNRSIVETRILKYEEEEAEMLKAQQRQQMDEQKRLKFNVEATEEVTSTIGEGAETSFHVIAKGTWEGTGGSDPYTESSDDDSSDDEYFTDDELAYLESSAAMNSVWKMVNTQENVFLGGAVIDDKSPNVDDNEAIATNISEFNAVAAADLVDNILTETAPRKFNRDSMSRSSSDEPTVESSPSSPSSLDRDSLTGDSIGFGYHVDKKAEEVSTVGILPSEREDAKHGNLQDVALRNSKAKDMALEHDSDMVNRYDVESLATPVATLELPLLQLDTDEVSPKSMRARDGSQIPSPSTTSLLEQLFIKGDPAVDVSPTGVNNFYGIARNESPLDVNGGASNDVSSETLYNAKANSMDGCLTGVASFKSSDRGESSRPCDDKVLFRTSPEDSKGEWWKVNTLVNCTLKHVHVGTELSEVSNAAILEASPQPIQGIASSKGVIAVSPSTVSNQHQNSKLVETLRDVGMDMEEQSASTASYLDGDDSPDPDESRQCFLCSFLISFFASKKPAFV